MSLFPTPDDDSLNEDELDKLEALCRHTQNEKLTDWEAEFLDNLAERYAQYGARSRISDKQWDIIDRIGGKLGL